jgi:putative ABC transport system permease protein
MNFFRSASLGFDKDAILNVPIPDDSIGDSKIEYLRNMLLKDPAIKNISFSFASPADNNNWSSDFKFDHSPKQTDFGASLKWADAEYFKTYNLQFVAGRPYYPSDTVREFVVNETLVQRLGLKNPQDAIGKQINFWDGNKVANIVGVVKDFHASSLRSPIRPVVLSTWKGVYQTMSVKIRSGDPKATLALIEKEWNGIFPAFVYEYQFLDEKINNFYSRENQQSQLYKIFAGIAIFISCLGLYGLVSFMAVQRTKEVGIRKVLGAGTGTIVYLFSKEFTVLIAIAFIIATPVAWYFMHQWLQQFVFRIQLGYSIFLLAIAGSIVIAWLTVGYRAVKAAMANPVKSLRAE